MKVCILTFVATCNYGATLQCYALSSFIKQQGHETLILNVPLQKAGETRKKKPIYERAFNKVMRTLHITRSDQRFVRTSKELLKEKELEAQNMSLFDVFREKFLKNISHEYINEIDFENDYPEADLYIVGSDQVWNLWVTNFQYPLFFFSFLKKDARRISYAACMGGDSNFDFSNSEIESISSLLSNFNGISVRDKTGINILSNRFNIKATQVLDPTFLIDSYDEILNDSNVDAKGCMFNFKFIINDKWVKVIKKISNDLNLKIRMDTCLIEIPNMPFQPLCSVSDWLKLIKTSDFVFTDSFHGMVFCILFKKQFIVTPSYEGGEERYSDLAQKLGLEDRLFYSYKDVINSEVWKKQIDYTMVYSKLDLLRIDSKQFLLKYLKDGIETNNRKS